MSHIQVIGANIHNLKKINVTLPKGKFIVFTGVSGSGKSSLAFDILYEEGRKHYLQSIGFNSRGEVIEEHESFEELVGLPPAIAVEQNKIRQSNPRSIVGTRTKALHDLKWLFALEGRDLNGERTGLSPDHFAGREDLSLIEWQNNLQEKGQSADLAITYEYYHWIERGLLEDLTPYIENDKTMNNPNIVEGTLETFKTGEQTYTVPVILDTYWFYVNKDLLKSLNLEMPSNDWTYDDMFELASKATDVSIQQYGLDFSSPITWYVKSVYSIANGHADHPFFMNGDLTESVIDTPEVIADLQWFYDLVNKYQVIINEKLIGTFPIQPFFQGKTLFIAAEYPPDPSWKFDWDVLPMPRGTKKQATMHQITPMGILKTSQYKEEAYKFISFFYELETQKFLADEAKVTTVRHPELDHYYDEIAHWKGKNVEAIKLSNTIGYLDPIVMDPVYHKQYLPLYHDNSWKIFSGEFSFSDVTKEIDNWSKNKVKFNLNK